MIAFAGYVPGFVVVVCLFVFGVVVVNIVAIVIIIIIGPTPFPSLC